MEMNRNEIERAIDYLAPIAEHISMTGEFCKNLKIALAALREQAERSKGCEVCNSLVAMRYETVCDWSDDGKAVWDTNTMHYCPMCGRKLEVKNE